jgi:2-polyprenyl-6-methoxyphenol hydroxylase-like FAD-dependent oxidoreductase
MNDVIVVGGGPTGTMLAGELRLWGLDPVVLERDPEPSPVVRGLGLHARTVEIMEMRGLLDRFLAVGRTYPLEGYFAGIKGADPALDTRHAYTLGIPQTESERILREHAEELGVRMHRSATVVDLAQDGSGVQVTLEDGSTVAGGFLVGCDGGRSVVRRLAGIGFPGEPARKEALLGELKVEAAPEEYVPVMTRVRETEKWFGLGPLGDGYVRLVVPTDGVAEDRRAPVTIEEVRARLVAVAGTDFGAHSPRWLSRFGDARRLADAYRADRVLLCGDAAHVHPPLGGQGLNLGIQDAVNLGWKLAGTVLGWAPDGLLDSYGSERRPVAAEVLDTTAIQGELQSEEPGPQAVRRLLTELAQLPEVSRRLIERVTATGIRYDVGEAEGGALLGRRLPDVSLRSGGRLFGRMRSGRGLLLDDSGALSVGGRDDRVGHAVDGSDEVTAPAVLLRPDGHVVWAGADQAGLDAALGRWFGTGG